MNNLPLTLTIEQQFELEKSKALVRRMSKEQAQELLLESIQQLMIKDNCIKHLIKEGPHI